MAIPIKNLYFMLCYAWNKLDEAEIVNVGAEDFTELGDLFGRVIISGVRHSLKDGLDRGYHQVDEDSACIRGRLDVDASLSRLLLRQGRAQCRVDELTTNILPNQIIKTTMWRLAQVKALDKELRKSLRQLCHRLSDVDLIRLTRGDFRRIQIYSNNRFYGFLIKVCQVISDALLVDEGDGEYLFRDFVQDEHAMRQVFQDFVFNFYRLHQKEYSVSRDRFSWDVDEVTDDVKALMPVMETDITLRSSAHAIIIDTKFSKNTLQGRFAKNTLRSEHLYQLFAYLKNLEHIDPLFRGSEGILLYPTTEETLNFSTQIQGHRLRVCTLDLANDASQIKSDLLEILEN
jgi:5-methylcytosine-specific restriction enzyme subunit McrC